MSAAVAPPPPAPPAIAAPSRRGGATVARIVETTRARSTPGGRTVARLEPETPWAAQAQTLLVLESRERAGHRWLRLLLPRRPVGRSGWVRDDRLALTTTRWWIDLRLASRRLRAYHAGRLVRSAAVVIGATATPTPTGLAAIYERLPQPDPAGFYGPWVLSLTALSGTLERFGGGPGRIGIHGRGGASLSDPLGSARSHGCIRVPNGDVRWLAARLPAGAPVRILP